mgnify:CR=1 FL=1
MIKKQIKCFVDSLPNVSTSRWGYSDTLYVFKFDTDIVLICIHNLSSEFINFHKIDYNLDILDPNFFTALKDAIECGSND